MNAIRLITLDDMYNGVQYTVRPGNRYQLTKDVEVTMLEPTIARVREWDLLTKKTFDLENEDVVIDPEHEEYYVRALAAKLLICCDVPPEYDTPDKVLAMPGLTTKPLRQINIDFIRLK